MSESINLFYGYEPKESIGAHVFIQSIFDKCSLPVSATALTPLLGEKLGIGTHGSTNSFGRLRFAVPYLCGFSGFAIYCDGSDQLVRTDLAELWALRDPWKAVQVVKHEYQTKHAKKYIGTELEADNQDYPRKNWSSLIIWNCAHFRHRNELTPIGINNTPAVELHRFSWLQDDQVGELPAVYNHLVGEQDPNSEAKIAHFTCGIPGFTHYAQSEFSQEWRQTLRNAQKGL